MTHYRGVVATTLDEFESRVRAILDEPEAAQWSPENLRRWLNDGLRDLSRSTRHYKGVTAQMTTVDVAEYTLPSNILAIEHAWYDDNTGRKRPLVARHLESMDQVWGSWQDRQGQPSWFTTVGNSPTLKIRLYPVPTTSGHFVRLNTAVLAAEVALDADGSTVVDVPDGWVDLLVDYATYLAFLRDRSVSPDGRMMWEAMFAKYQAGRQALVNSNDYLAVNRELVPDPVAGYVPLWHLDDDDFGWW